MVLIEFTINLQFEIVFFIFNFVSSNLISVVFTEFIPSSSNFVKFRKSSKLKQLFSSSSLEIFVRVRHEKTNSANSSSLP